MPRRRTHHAPFAVSLALGQEKGDGEDVDVLELSGEGAAELQREVPVSASDEG